MPNDEARRIGRAVERRRLFGFRISVILSSLLLRHSSFLPSLPRFLLFFFEFSLEVLAFADELAFELVGCLPIPFACGLLEFAFEENFALGDFSAVFGIEFSEFLLLLGSQFGGWPG